LKPVEEKVTTPKRPAGQAPPMPAIIRSFAGLCLGFVNVGAWVFDVSVGNPRKHLFALRKHLFGTRAQIGKDLDRDTSISTMGERV
jgi:hypothetical protein